MMPSNNLQLGGVGAPRPTSSAPEGGAQRDSGFMADLLSQIERKTGRSVDPRALASWLEEHSDEVPAVAPDGLLPLLAGLVDRSAHTGLPASGSGGRVDPNALLGLLTAASGGSTRAAGQAGDPVAGILAALGAGDDGMAPGQAGDDPDAKSLAAFQNLLQGVTGSSAATSPATENRAGIPTLQMSTPVADAGFGQAVGERMVWMVQNEVQQARLLLSPPGLGPLDIAVSLHGDEISIALNAQHAVTREALAADASRLRGMLTEAGFNAVDVNVSQDEGRGDRSYSGPAPQDFAASGVAGGVESIEPALGEPRRVGLSLVDHYA